MGKNTKHYYVDLRSFPPDERKELYERLAGFSFICNPFLDRERFGIYDVIWDSSTPIEEFLKISPEYIHLLM